MRPTLILRDRLVDEDGDVMELGLWRVPKSSRYPEGVRYCLVFMLAETKRPVVVYANHYPTGHQRQFYQIEEPYAFSTAERLVADFEADIVRAKGPLKGA
jgi:hypothetical protein